MQNIIYRNKAEFDKKLEAIRLGGVEKLHFLADFDRTLTTAYINWKRTWSLVSVLRTEEAQLWGECAKKDTELFNKYYPIEIDNSINIEEKKKKMIEWWTKSFNLFIEYWLSKNALREVAKTDKLALRGESNIFFNYLNYNNIPLVIISASGIWKLSIEYFLEYRDVFLKNIYIISNDFDWDENGNALSFKYPIIHSFNKDETLINAFPEIYQKVENRKNVILLWDSLWDHHMADWFDYDNLICIGFLNEKEDELLEEYKVRYDVVLTWDPDMSFINNLLKELW